MEAENYRPRKANGIKSILSQDLRKLMPRLKMGRKKILSSSFILFRLLTDWMRPSYIKEGGLLYSISSSVSSGNFLTDTSVNNIQPDIWRPRTTTRCRVKLTFTIARQGFVTRHVPSLLQQPYWKSPALWCVGVRGCLQSAGCDHPSHSRRCTGAVWWEQNSLPAHCLSTLNLTSDDNCIAHHLGHCKKDAPLSALCCLAFL